MIRKNGSYKDIQPYLKSDVKLYPMKSKKIKVYEKEIKIAPKHVWEYPFSKEAKENLLNNIEKSQKYFKDHPEEALKLIEEKRAKITKVFVVFSLRNRYNETC